MLKLQLVPYVLRQRIWMTLSSLYVQLESHYRPNRVCVSEWRGKLNAPLSTVQWNNPSEGKGENCRKSNSKRKPSKRLDYRSCLDHFLANGQQQAHSYIRQMLRFQSRKLWGREVIIRECVVQCNDLQASHCRKLHRGKIMYEMSYRIEKSCHRCYNFFEVNTTSTGEQTSSRFCVTKQVRKKVTTSSKRNFRHYCSAFTDSSMKIFIVTVGFCNRFWKSTHSGEVSIWLTYFRDKII